MTGGSTVVFSSLAKIILVPIKILKWLVLWLVGSVALSLIITTPAEGIEAQKLEAVTENCHTIKRSLDQLQKVDSRTRTYLGTTYETIANRFITPLNLRLVKNNRPTLSEIQSDFSAAQVKFRDAYTTYMRELEGLIAIDCRSRAEEFYSQLIIVRGKRADLRNTTDELSQLANAQYQAVLNLKDSL